jgi:hypothetical protein
VFRATLAGKVIKRIDLEPDPITKELAGPAFLLGADEDDTHTTYDKGWPELPPYPELEAAVLDAIRGTLVVEGAQSHHEGWPDPRAAEVGPLRTRAR